MTNSGRRIEKIIDIDARLRIIRLVSRISACAIGLGGIATVARGMSNNHENMTAGGIGLLLASMVIVLCGRDANEKIKRVNDISDDIKKNHFSNQSQR